MRKWYPVVLIIATIVVSAIVYPRLPDRVPMHWNFRGEANSYWSRGRATVLVPLLLLGTWGLMRGLPMLDPRRANYAKMQGTYDLLVNSALTVIVFMHLAALGVALGLPIRMERVLPIVIGVVLVIVGNVLPRARPNWYFGIRTPWTLSNDRVWARTHRFGGYVVSATGLATIVVSAFALQMAMPVVGVLGGVAALASITYSYVAWKQETSR